MSIRGTILFAFMTFGALVAASLTMLAYTRSRDALNAEIRTSLQDSATVVMEQIDALLFERVVDVGGWLELDVLQEARIGDVDKRLARFFSEVHDGYAGTYNGLQFIAENRVLAASDPTVIGSRVPPAGMTFDIPLERTVVRVEAPDLSRAVPVLTLHADVPDRFSGGMLGELRAQVDWSEVGQILAGAASGNRRGVVLLGEDGKVLAGGGALPQVDAEVWSDLTRRTGGMDESGVLELGDWPESGTDWLAGHARQTRYKGLPDMGWHLFVLVPKSAAFAPALHLLHAQLALLVAVFLVAAVLAIDISRRIARPVVELTRMTRDMLAEGNFVPAHVGGNSEVRELAGSFNRLLEDLNRSRDDLIRVSKLAAVGEMSALLAHEVRNPLGVIRSSAQLLERQPGLDARGREILSLLLKECDRINDLVTALLDSARPRAVTWNQVAIGEIASALGAGLGAAADRKGIRLEVDVSSQESELRCDRELMHRMLLNLSMNAIQMTPSGGRVRIRIRSGPEGTRFEVDDSGPGIPEPDRRRVLEPFFSRRPGGVGLGLAVVHNIVRQHRGTIVAGASDLGGARFTVELPHGAMSGEA